VANAQADWRSEAACRSADPELFFPLTAAGLSIRELTEAMQICGRCRVRMPCLEFALAVGEVHGVWGGTSEEERRRMLLRRTATGRTMASAREAAVGSGGGGRPRH
jgi:WhiB family redox-sensing transcriptional regulator